MLEYPTTNYGRALQRGLIETPAPVRVRRYGHQRIPHVRNLPREARAALREGKVVRSTTSGIDIFPTRATCGRIYYHARHPLTVQ